MTVIRAVGLILGALVATSVLADWQARVSDATANVTERVVELRHHFHANPELGNREFKTSKKIADHLRSLGFDSVEEGVAHTGVVGILKGSKPGPTVALRADMDGLPVAEKTGLPFASKVTTEWRGIETGVMHACGHDAHMAILLGVAEVLSGMRDQIPGTVKFIFQPAEEGPPEDEEGGAELMIKEGVLKGEYAPGAIFGLHVFPQTAGVIMYKPEGMMAAADGLYIKVKGVQTHGSMPWGGVDPITAAAQIINSLQTIVSRQVDISNAPAVVTIGSINGGNRGNIIPEEVEMTGTIRTFDMAMREDVHARVKKTAELVAASFGATAEVTVNLGVPVTHNDPVLTAQMAPVLQRTAAGNQAVVIKPIMGAEDFSFFANEIPALFVGLGVAKDGVKPGESASNHSPYFYVNDRALPYGVETLSGLALEWLHAQQEN
ncbi:MAG: amidohydrolase [Gammaproteobacteria bacterium]|jgi:amidohydrolase|nr:amidohydrolase [Gammaproteobacteria bacterium]